MSKLQVADSFSEFVEVLHAAENNEGGDDRSFIEYRPRTSKKESDWIEIETNHLFDQAHNNYRIGEFPDLRLDNGDITTPGGDCMSLSDARALYKMLLKAYRAKKEVEMDQYDGDNDFGYTITLDESGFVKIGCQGFEWDELVSWARKFGLHKNQ